MPIYEYRCNTCGRRMTILARGYSSPDSMSCERCGSSDVSRLISRFSVLKSESRLDDLSDAARWGDIDESDPRSLARWMRKMEVETGEDMGPEFDELVDRMEAGEMPQDLGADVEDSTFE